jgi:hypothetical protein
MPTDPTDIQELNKRYREYIQLLQIADGLDASAAKAKADTAKATGTLVNEINRLNKSLDDTLIKSDYLYNSFKETTAELKNQNVALNIGKSVFKGLTDIASTLSYYQQGITDLEEKQLKKQRQRLDISEVELGNIEKRLSNSNGEYNNQNLLTRLIGIKKNSAYGLTKSQEKLLDQLQKEKSLLESAQNALEEGIPILRDELKISRQIYDVRKDIGGLATAAAGVISQFGGSLAQFLNVGEAIESVNEYNKKVIEGALKSKEVITKLNKIEDDRRQILERSLSISEDIARISKDLQDANNAAQITANNNAKIQEIQNKLSQQGLLSANEIQQLHDEKTRLQNESLRVQNLANNSVNIETNLKRAQARLQQNTIDEKKELAALDKKEVEVKQKAIESTNTIYNKFKSLGLLLKELATGGLKKALTDPLTIITFFLNKALEANRQTVELGKSLGYGNDRAYQFRENMAEIARNSTNVNVTAASLTEAFNELSQATGLAVEFTADQLETQVKLTKQVGLQADEAAQVQRFAVLNGKTSEETYKSFVKGLATTRNQLKVGINFKATLAEALKVSGQLAASLGNNPEMIAKAVVTAKAFGMTLEQVAKAGESLLDFGSSISNELEAELLTGKQLNLERARAAALAGDQITLAEELNKNIGSSAEFTKMNILQQNALAKSVGMTSDELANTLRKREEAVKQGKSLAQITEEEAQQALERQTIQDKFNQAILKLQDFFGNLVAGPVGQLLDAITQVVGVVSDVLQPVLSTVFTPLIWAAKTLGGMSDVLKTMLYTFIAIRGVQLGINTVKKIALGYDIAMKAANQISANLGLAQIGTNRVKVLLEKESLVTRIAGNVQLFNQLVAEHGLGKALKIQLGIQQATNSTKQKGLLITMKDWLYEKGKVLWMNLQKAGMVVLNTLKTIGSAITKREAIFSIANAAMDAMSAAVSGIGAFLGPLAIPIGIAAAAGVAALGYNLLKGDDIMSEGGYGKRTLLAPEGAIRLNDNDTVIAGTNLNGSSKNKKGDDIISKSGQDKTLLSPKGSIEIPSINPGKNNETISMPQIDLTPMIAAINEVKIAINNLSKQPAVAVIEGKDAFSKDVAQRAARNTRKVA